MSIKKARDDFVAAETEYERKGREAERTEFMREVLGAHRGRLRAPIINATIAALERVRDAQDKDAALDTELRVVEMEARAARNEQAALRDAVIAAKEALRDARD